MYFVSDAYFYVFRELAPWGCVSGLAYGFSLKSVRLLGEVRSSVKRGAEKKLGPIYPYCSTDRRTTGHAALPQRTCVSRVIVLVCVAQ